ncbi:response regulator [Paraburkholderia tropica]|uniref:response regulator n=1 Tax=Paraburkholderia tropica TaxID=92647 RepID=UPI002AB03F44|nr:response regulator [Paraburkholderia tropica]
MKRILLVDDDLAALESLAAALSGEFLVATASDGGSAWRYLKHTDVDIVITDLRMPGMSGGVLCEKIRDDVTLASMPVILVSGEYSPPAFVRYDCYLRKPLNIGQLVAVLRRLLVPDPHRATGAMQSRAPKSNDGADE